MTKYKKLLALTVLSFASTSLAATDSAISKALLCKAGIATVMGRDPNIMKARNAEPIVYVSYTRDDGEKYSYKCKIEGNRIIWGNTDGRWRNHYLDSKVIYRVAGQNVFVEDQYSDGSATKKSFSLSQLGK